MALLILSPLLAAGTTQPPAPTDGLADVYLQYGAIGATVIVLGIVLYRVFAKYQQRSDEAYEREKQRADSAEAKYDALQTVMRTEVAPVLARATDAQAKLMDALPEILAMARQRER